MSKFLDTRGIEVRETVPASRKLGRSEAASLVREAATVFVAKGKKLDRFQGGTASAKIVDALLGPTGNLRSPTLRIGKTVIVGFDAETLAQALFDDRRS